MADGPANTPIGGAHPTATCCDFHRDGGVFYVSCKDSPPPAPPPRPTFNHSREDGPFAPCPECAALMGPASREALYRDLLCCLLDQMAEMMVSDGHDCATNGRFACCRAWLFLDATEGAKAERRSPPDPPPFRLLPKRGSRWVFRLDDTWPTVDILVVSADEQKVSFVPFGTFLLRECSLGEFQRRATPWLEPPPAAPAPRTNGGVICDMDEGPCSCGAWHELGLPAWLPAGGKVGRAP